MKKEEMIRRYKMLHEIEERFNDDIYEIVCQNRDFLNDVYYMKNEDLVEVCDCIFDIFFYEKIYSYQQDEAVKDGLIYAINNYMRDISNETREYEKIENLQEIANKKVRQYMDDFVFPVFTDEYAGKALFEEVMALPDENTYKLKLWYALLHPIYEELDEVDKYQMISDVLVYYDFEYKFPQEVKSLAEEWHRIKNHIPDFTNVKEGQTWSGAHRYSKFIKDLKLRKYKSGSNSHKAQIKSISRSCKWEDDEQSKVITLIEIYPERMEKEISSRARKYEDYFKLILLYHLQRCDGIFKCSTGKFWINTYILPRNYKNISIRKYIEQLHIKETSIDELQNNLNIFHRNTDARLKEILEPNLEYLARKGIVHLDKQIVIVIGNKHIPLDEIDEVGLTYVEAKEMIAKANEYSFNKLSGNFYNDKTGQIEKRHPRSFSEVMSLYKKDEHKELFEEYIQENYGWEYTYEEYVIRLNDNWKDKTVTYEAYADAKKELNNLVVEAVKNNNITKNNNLNKKYDEEETRIQERIEQNTELRELLELCITDEDGIIQNKQYKYPESFIQQLDSFVETELMF